MKTFYSKAPFWHSEWIYLHSLVLHNLIRSKLKGCKAGAKLFSVLLSQGAHSPLNPITLSKRLLRFDQGNSKCMTEQSYKDFNSVLVENKF